MIDSEVICCVEAPATLKEAAPGTTLPSGLVAIAVMAVVPWLTPVARPVAAPIVATPAVLEVQATLVVTFVCAPVKPEVAMAMNCPV